MARSGDKPLVWLKNAVRTPPFSARARVETGVLLRRLQQGEVIGLPHSRPMPLIGPHCHELRVNDENQNWRIVYYLAADAVVILEIFSKKTAAMPSDILTTCRKRLAAYLKVVAGGERKRR